MQPSLRRRFHIESHPIVVALAAAFGCALAGMSAAAQDSGAEPVDSAAAASAVTEPEAPIEGFLYVEPFEIRAEFTVRVAASGLAPELVPGLAPDMAAAGPIDAAGRTQVLDGFRAAARSACRLTTPDGEIDLTLDTLEFIVIDPEEGAQLDDREFIPWEDAMLGGVLATAREDFPASIDLDWRLFTADGAEVPVAVEVASGADVRGEAFAVTPSAPGFEWTLPDIAPPPGLVNVAAVRTETVLAPWLVAGGLGLAGVVLTGLGLRGPAGQRGGRILAGLVAIAVGAGAFVGMGGGTRQAMPQEAESREVVEGLLRNVYHAFAHREEQRIYATLAESVQGDLRETLYLDIQRGLADEKDGGPRVKILEVTLVDCSVDRIGGRPGMRANAVWISGGDVSHWGHVHRRRNQYRGLLTIEPVGGAWKLTEVTILDEQRT